MDYVPRRLHQTEDDMMAARDGSDSDSDDLESAAPKRDSTRAMKENIAPDPVQTPEPQTTRPFATLLEAASAPIGCECAALRRTLALKEAELASTQSELDRQLRLGSARQVRLEEVEETLQSVIAQTDAELEDVRAEARLATETLYTQGERHQERDVMAEQALGMYMVDVTELTARIDALEATLCARDAHIRDLQRAQRADAPDADPAWFTYRAAPPTPFFVHPSTPQVPQTITESDAGWISDAFGPDMSSGLRSDDEWSDLYTDDSVMSDVGTPARASSPPLSVSSELGEHLELLDSSAGEDGNNGMEVVLVAQGDWLEV